MKQRLASSVKQMIPVLAAAVLFGACTAKPRTQAATTTVTDTAGLARFQAYKQAEQAKADAAAANAIAAQQQPATTSKTVKRNNTTVYNSESSQSAKAAQKKGWSKSAKGAVIGGVAGGVTGAVVNKKNRVAGGVIGAAVGAGAGYMIGRDKDKKDGRKN